MQAFEVGDFRGIACFGEGLKAGADEFARAAAKNGLFAEQITFGLLLKGGFDDARFEATDAIGISQCVFESLAGRVLRDSDEAGNADAFGEQFANAMAGGFGGDHGHVDIGGRLDFVEVNVEAVREHEGFALGHVRGDFVLIGIALHVIGDEDHDDISGLGGVGDAEHFEARALSFGDALAGGW